MQSTKKQPLFRPPSPDSGADTDDDELAAGLANLSVEKASVPSVNKGKARAQVIPDDDEEEEEYEEESTQETQESLNMPPEDRTLLMSETADLCLFDAATEMFMEQEKATQANLWVVKGLPFPCA